MFDFNNVNSDDNSNLKNVITPLVYKSFLTMENLPKIFEFLFDIQIKIKLANTYSVEFGKPVYFINIWDMDEDSILKLDTIKDEDFVFNQLDDYYDYKRFEDCTIMENNFIYVNKCFTLFQDSHEEFCYHISYNEDTFDFDLIKYLFL